MGDMGHKSFWETVRARLEQDVYVSEQQIRDILSVDEAVPPDLADYVQERLGEFPRRGRPRHTTEEAAERLAESVELGFEVSLRQAGYRRQGMSAPRERALESVAREQAMSPETLRDRLGQALRRHRKVRRFLVPADEADALLREMLAAGLVHMDREKGCVRVSDKGLSSGTRFVDRERKRGPRRQSKGSDDV